LSVKHKFSNYYAAQRGNGPLSMKGAVDAGVGPIQSFGIVNELIKYDAFISLRASFLTPKFPF